VGYVVFNTASNLVQDKGPGFNVSKEIGLQYIDCVLHGRFPNSTTYEEKKVFTRRFILLSYTVLHVDGVSVYEYLCRCKCHRKDGECDHEASTSHLLKTFDVLAQVHKITSGSVRGRPRLSSVVGFAAIKDKATDLSSLHKGDYEKLVREQIVQFYNLPFSQLPFIGTVIGGYK
jgi:hypothetical protein